VDEAEELEWSQNVLDYYCGTYAETSPAILSAGPRPTLGAGAELLLTHYGMEIPGLYVAKALHVATTYPMPCITGEVVIGGDRFHGDGVAGGTVIASDGTSPLRAVLRCVAPAERQLWHRGSKQALFMPEGMYCNRLVFMQ
jgi:hypothetical protein